MKGNNVKAMILAAGRGERMRPLTDHTPKPLLRVGDEPLIGWHLRRLKAVGIEEIVINYAWLGAQIEQQLGDGAAYGVEIRYSAEGASGLETAGGIATALDLLGEEPFLVINGDVLTDVNFAVASKIAEKMNENNVLAHLWLVDNPEHNPQGDFALLENQYVSADVNLGKSATFSGIGVYSPALFADLPKNQVAKLAPLLRQAMNAQQVTGQWHSGLWLDVGTVERLAMANSLAKQGQL